MVSSFTGSLIVVIFLQRIRHAETKQEVDFVELCIKWRQKVSGFMGIIHSEASEGELAAFISYAIAFPDSFIALIDTYNVIR